MELGVNGHLGQIAKEVALIGYKSGIVLVPILHLQSFLGKNVLDMSKKFNHVLM